MTVPRRITMHADDFFTGLVAALAERGVTSVAAGPTLHRAVAAAARTATAKTPGDFTIRFDGRESATVRAMIAAARLRDIVGVTSDGTLRLLITKSAADAYYPRLPGDREEYRAAARTFLEQYPPFRA